MEPSTGRRATRFRLLSLALAAGMLAIEASFLPLPGIQQDEALFVQPFLRGGSSLFGVHGVPVMLMDYVGALKTWLYWPVFGVWHPGIWSIRLPACAASAVTLLLFVGLARRAAGGAVALCAALLLATDASFLFANTFDWGPAALTLLGAVAVIALLARSPRPYAAFFLAGVLLWYKAVFIFPLAGILIAFAAAFPRQARRRMTAGCLAGSAAALLLGASPLILFNLRTRGATLQSASRLERAPVAEKLLMLRLTLDGKALEHYMFRDSPDEVLPLRGAPLGQLVRSWYRRSSLGPGGFLLPALALCAGALPLIRRSPLFAPIVFAWVAGLTTFALMLPLGNAGAGPHHTVLVYPAPQFIVAATAAALAGRLGARRRRWAAAGAVGLIAASNCVLLAGYRGEALRNGFSVYWTDATRALAADLRNTGKPAAFLDWGIEAGARIESGDTLRPAPPDPPRAGVVYVTHCEGYRIDAAAARFAAPGRTVADSHGRPMFLLFEMR